MPLLEIPGLHSRLGLDDFVRMQEMFAPLSCAYEPPAGVLANPVRSYNSLPAEHHQPTIEDSQLQGGAEIIAKYDEQDRIAMHLLHSHGVLDSDNVMVTRKISKSATATSPVFVKQPMSGAQALRGGPLSPRVLAAREDKRVHPCELKEAKRPQEVLDINIEVFREFAEYVIRHKIHQVLGLQLLDSEESQDPELVEVEDGAGGTATFYSHDVPDSEHTRTTTWVVEKIDGVVSWKGGEGHSRKPGDTKHTTFSDGKFS
jgi:hypothetical protein